MKALNYFIKIFAGISNYCQKSGIRNWTKLLLTFSFISVIYEGTAQTAYIQLSNSSGVTYTVEEKNELDSLVNKIRIALVEKPQVKFSVYEFDFYLLDESKKGVESTWQEAINLAESRPESDYFLLFGKVSDPQNGIHNKLMISLKFPDRFGFECLDLNFRRYLEDEIEAEGLRANSSNIFEVIKESLELTELKIQEAVCKCSSSRDQCSFTENLLLSDEDNPSVGDTLKADTLGTDRYLDVLKGGGYFLSLNGQPIFLEEGTKVTSYIYAGWTDESERFNVNGMVARFTDKSGVTFVFKRLRNGDEAGYYPVKTSSASCNSPIRYKNNGQIQPGQEIDLYLVVRKKCAVEIQKTTYRVPNKNLTLCAPAESINHNDFVTFYNFTIRKATNSRGETYYQRNVEAVNYTESLVFNFNCKESYYATEVLEMLKNGTGIFYDKINSRVTFTFDGEAYMVEFNNGTNPSDISIFDKISSSWVTKNINSGSEILNDFHQIFDWGVEIGQEIAVTTIGFVPILGDISDLSSAAYAYYYERDGTKLVVAGGLAIFGIGGEIKTFSKLGQFLSDISKGASKFKGTKAYEKVQTTKNNLKFTEGLEPDVMLISSKIENGVKKNKAIPHSKLTEFAKKKGVNMDHINEHLKNPSVRDFLIRDNGVEEALEIIEVLSKAGDDPILKEILDNAGDLEKLLQDFKSYDSFRQTIKSGDNAALTAWHLLKKSDPNFIPCK